MVEIFKLYKKLGETPLECLMRFKEKNPPYQDKRLTYLGRLDPMAEGLLLVAEGSVKKEEYLSLDKTYEFEVLWGVETDTYDILGLITNIRHGANVKEKNMLSVVEKISKFKTQSYPPYSSRTVDGKPLWEWSREEKISEIELPTRNIKVFSINHIHTRYAEAGEILREVGERIALVQGDFRQKEILKKWQKEFGKIIEEKFLISKFVTDVSGGTYIRFLAHQMGEILGTGACVWSIKRTRVGEFRL